MSEADILKWDGKYGAIAAPVAAEPDKWYRRCTAMF